MLNRVQLFVNPWTHSPCSSPGKNTRVGSLYLLQGILPTQGSNPGLLHCGQILILAEPQGKPKNTGVDSLSLLQRIFPTQESNQGLLHCRQILYQLSYQGSLELPNDPLIPVLPQRIENRGSNEKGLPRWHSDRESNAEDIRDGV